MDQFCNKRSNDFVEHLEYKEIKIELCMNLFKLLSHLFLLSIFFNLNLYAYENEDCCDKGLNKGVTNSTLVA